ncbi:MAG: hypothetical protein RLZZ511_3302 [Cyanobacteriota bacterium]|jgi:hypothetical protein
MSEQLTIHTYDLWQQAKHQLQLPQLIEQAIHRHIITLTAQQQGIEVAVSELQASADQLRIQHQLLTAQATIAWLEKHRLSVEDLEDIAQFNVLVAKLKTALIEPQIESYFYRNQLDYAQAVYYEIVVAQRELAMELFYALQERELDFLAVLHRYVDDREVRVAGSYRQVVQRQDVSAELSALIFAAQAPQVLRPLPIGDAMRLIYVVELLPPVLDESLRGQLRDQLFEDWLEKARSGYDIQLDLALK